MAKKKVVDADILLIEVERLCHVGINFPHTYPNNGGSLDAAVQNAINQNNIMIANHIRAAFTTLSYTLKEAIRTASREEDGGLCGLCRVDDNACMPMDFRPFKQPDPTPPAEG